MTKDAPKSKRVLVILSFFLFLLVLGLGSFLVLMRVPRLQSINFYLNECDSYVRQEKFNSANDSLEKATSFTEGQFDWIRIIKRAHGLSQVTNDWNYLKNYSERAVKLYQGNGDLWAYYLSSLLWTGNYDEAQKYSERLTDDRYASIKAEIRLAQESLRIDDTLPPYEGVMRQLDQEKEGDFYSLVGSITGIDGIKIDAALLWMGLGNKERALEEINSLNNPAEYAQILGLILWDMEMYDQSMSYLIAQNMQDIKNHNNRWTLNNIIADGFLMKEEWEKAEFYYLNSLEINSGDNWRAQINRALLYEKVGVFKKSSELVFDALKDHSDQQEVVLYFLKNWQEVYPVRAERVVAQYLMDNPYEVDVLLEKYIYFPKEMTPEKYRAFLWELFNENSESEKVCRYLISYLIGVGDFQGVQIIMERYEKIIGYQPTWFSLYKGIIYSLSSPPQFLLAEEEFKKYHGQFEDPFGEHNLRVLLNKLGKSQEADLLESVTMDEK